MNEITDSIRSTLTGLVTGLVEFFPSLLLALFILAVGWLLARLVRAIVVRLGQRVGFDKLIERTGLTGGLQQAQITQTPSSLVAALFYWLILLNFLLTALKHIGLSEAVQPLEKFIGFLPSVVAGLVTLILGSLLVQFVSRAVQGALAGMGIDFHQALGNIVRVLLMAIVVIIVIEQIGLDVTLLTNLFTSVLTIVVAGLALAFGLGGREVARNVLAGFYARELFAVGDVVVIDEVEGVLEGISTLNAEIRVGEDRVTIPNTRLTDATVRQRKG